MSMSCMMAWPKVRVDFDGTLEVFARLVAAPELGQHLRVGEVDQTMIGRALEHGGQHFFRLGVAAGAEKNQPPRR